MSISHHRMLAKYLKQVKSGNNEAFTELSNSLSMTIYYGVLRMVKDPDDALTLSKEVMVEVYRNVPRLNGAEELLEFIDRMVYLRSIDFLRKGQKLSDLPSTSEETTPEELEAFLSQDIRSQANQVDLVLAAIDQLPDQLRAIILLYYYNGYTVEEMGRILSWDEETITKQFYSAHDVLKTLLREEHITKGGAAT